MLEPQSRPSLLKRCAQYGDHETCLVIKPQVSFPIHTAGWFVWHTLQALFTATNPTTALWPFQGYDIHTTTDKLAATIPSVRKLPDENVKEWKVKIRGITPNESPSLAEEGGRPPQIEWKGTVLDPWNVIYVLKEALVSLIFPVDGKAILGPAVKKWKSQPTASGVFVELEILEFTSSGRALKWWNIGQGVTRTINTLAQQSRWETFEATLLAGADGPAYLRVTVSKGNPGIKGIGDGSLEFDEVRDEISATA